MHSMETISDITQLHGDGVRKTTKTIQQLAMLSDRLVAAIGNFKIAESGARVEIARPKPLASAPAQPQQHAKPQPPQPTQTPPQPPQPRPKPQPIEAKASQPPQPPQPMPPAQSQAAQDAAQLRTLFGSREEDEDEMITEEDFGILEK